MGTVVLQTRGLEVALGDAAAFRNRDDQAPWRDCHQQRCWIDGIGGMVIVAAPAPVLRSWGVEIFQGGQHPYQGSESENSGYRGDRNGEVQVLVEFSELVIRAQAARERLFPGRARLPLTQEERERVWALDGAEPLLQSEPNTSKKV
jgi:hypothetical protein